MPRGLAPRILTIKRKNMQNNVVRNVGLAILRIAPSAMLLTHGIPKFQKIINGNLEFGDPLGIGAAPSLFLAVIGEFICPILIIIGFKTRWMAVPPAITMAVAGFIHHAPDDFGTKEKALLYLIYFIVIILLGPGKYSVGRK
jgi:putative oxidoreductase